MTPNQDIPPPTDGSRPTRRQVLSALGGVLLVGFGNWLSGDLRHELSLPSSTHPSSMSSSQTLTSRQSQKPAYIALPGASTASLLANLSYLLSTTDSSPVLLVDRHDFDRLRSIALTDPDSPWNRNYLLAYRHLYRRGIVRFIDYADFYPRSIQREALERTNALLDGIGPSDQQRGAVTAADGRIQYQRGHYQESFRTGLSQELSVFTNGRQTEEARRDRLARGTVDPRKWNERSLAQYLAALHIRQYADDVLDFDVKGIVGEGERTLIRNVASESYHIGRLEPNQYLLDLPIDELASTRTLFDTIRELAIEIVGVQHDDWIHLESTFALPDYHELFEPEVLREELNTDRDIDALTREVRQVIGTLQPSDDGFSSSRLTYIAD